METTLNTYQLLEYEFTKGLVEFINSFNELDYNLGLCIAWLITGKSPNLTYTVIQKLSAHEKIESLKLILNDRKFEEYKELVDEFNSWFLIAKKSKAYRYRNFFIHGKWRTISPHVKKPIIFQSLNLCVTKDLQFSLDEFRNFTNEMRAVTNKFHKLREKLFLGVYE